MKWTLWTLLLAPVLVAAQIFDIQSALSTDGVIYANDRLLNQVFKSERDYAVALLLTAEGPQFNCQFCQILGPSFRETARNWKQQHPDGGDLYFIVADIDSCKNAYETLRLTSAPTFKLYHPSKGSEKLGLLADSERLEFSQVDQQAEYVANWLTGQGYPVTIVKPFNWERFGQFAGTLVAVLVGGYVFRERVVKLLQSKQLWLALSLVSIILFTSGHMFNVIRKTPLTGWNNGQTSYFEGGFTTQFAIETQIIAVLYAIISFAVICLIVRAPAIPSAIPQTVLIIALAGIVLLGYSQLINIFKIKTGYYPYGLLPFSIF